MWEVTCQLLPIQPAILMETLVSGHAFYAMGFPESLIGTKGNSFPTFPHALLLFRKVNPANSTSAHLPFPYHFDHRYWFARVSTFEYPHL
jgi:hypothetical protein